MDPINILIVVVVLPVAAIIGAVLRSSRRGHTGPSARTVTLPDRNVERVVRGLLNGPRPQKILAIKVVRERTGLGPREAKEYVDALEVGSIGDTARGGTGAGRKQRRRASS